jgi:hypothetical protein
MKRDLLKSILSSPITRRELLIGVIIAAQAREGIDTTYEQAAAAYDRVQEEKGKTNGNP